RRAYGPDHRQPGDRRGPGGSGRQGAARVAGPAVMTASVPVRADVEAAAFRIGAAIRRTPVVELDLRDHGIEADVRLKLELLQHTGSFKTRGALNAVLSLPTSVTGVCAASGGNHAAAVAWA